MKINEAKALIKTALRLAREKQIYIAIEIISGPGMGKSAIQHQAAEETAAEWNEPVGCYPFFLSTVEAPDVRGYMMPVQEADGTMVSKFTQAPWMPPKDAPQYGIINLDEFRQANHDTQKPAAELFLNRKVGGSSLPPGYIVTACSNRETDRSGVQRELAFITNRRMVIKIEPNLDSWVDWAERKSVHPLAIAFAKFKPATVFTDTIPEKPGPFCTPRSMVMLSQLIGELDMMTFTEAACGLIGDGAAAEFVAFLRVAEELPSFEEIVANPTKTEVPKRPDASYAAMQMLAHRIDAKTAQAAFTYLKRMGREFQVAGLRGTFRRVPDLIRTPEFSSWLRDNKELVMAANLLGK